MKHTGDTGPELDSAGGKILKVPPSAMLDDVLQTTPDPEPIVEVQRPEYRTEAARELDQYEPEFQYAMQEGGGVVKELMEWFKARTIDPERAVVYCLLCAAVLIRTISERSGELSKGIATACEMLRRMARHAVALGGGPNKQTRGQD